MVGNCPTPPGQLPTIYLYDNCPGGVGLCEKVYDILPMLLDRAAEAIAACPCENGCPSCVGPAAEVGASGKQTALRILGRLRARSEERRVGKEGRSRGAREHDRRRVFRG